ncbi:MAG: 4-hydroxythreonine-4-phosphate dehydrogenase PdxA [Thermoplasmataceae archaeon]
MRVAVTMGDPAGIGPEIVAKAVLKLKHDANNLVIVGNRKIFMEAADHLGLDRNALMNLEIADVESGNIEKGKPSQRSGKVALESIAKSVEMCRAGDAQAICTAPISKEAIRMAGSPYIDHTEMLGHMTSTSKVVTMFQTQNLRIVFATKHLPITQAIRKISRELIVEYISLADMSLKLLGIQRRRIAVAALNPHAGEDGLLGTEEIEVISPAVKHASADFDVSGPYPADSVFYRASLGEFDVVVSLYHDQGHIAAKMLDFHGTVSMNLGLPFLRTSVDHGTAFDIAGMGIAREDSMVAAIKLALEKGEIYSRNYRSFAVK